MYKIIELLIYALKAQINPKQYYTSEGLQVIKYLMKIVFKYFKITH